MLHFLNFLRKVVPIKQSIYHCQKYFFRSFLLIFFYLSIDSAPSSKEQNAQAVVPDCIQEEIALTSSQVGVKPFARDDEIQNRLQSVLVATEWFTAPQVRVEEGVVFLRGQVESDELKKWAGDLARNTQDVVAVANRMEVLEAPVWDFRPAWKGLVTLWRSFIRSLPFIAFGLIILVLSMGIALLATRGARTFLRKRIQANLLRDMIARGIGVLVFLFGLHIVLRVSGLTQLALTVVGGTGLIGLAVGIAFRDITENFLASIFLSSQRPFQMGDLIEVAGETGFVKQLNVRTTILMTLEGNLVQVPNASVYKGNLRNFTTNSNRREDFFIGIGYEESINDALEIVRKVLINHPAILSDPEPSVLVDNLGKSTINLRVYFWINGHEHSWIKAKSSVIRLVTLAFQQQGISMPAEVREIIFPDGIPVTICNWNTEETQAAASTSSHHDELATVSTKAEAGLYSESVVIDQQAKQAQPLQSGENLLPADPRSR
jgi:small conductance mechanosensitive channel